MVAHSIVEKMFCVKLDFSDIFQAIVIIHKIPSTDGGKHLRIANSMPYREMLDISGVTQYIELYNTVDEAVASF